MREDDGPNAAETASVLTIGATPEQFDRFRLFGRDDQSAGNPFSSTVGPIFWQVTATNPVGRCWSMSRHTPKTHSRLRCSDPRPARQWTSDMSLHPDFVIACKTHLPELFRIWLSVDPEDQRWVTRIIEQDDHHTQAESSIERYKGARTSTAFRKGIEESEAYHSLSKAIIEYQPELTHYLIIPERDICLADLSHTPALISTWCRFLEGRNGGGTSLDAVNDLLKTLEQMIETKTLTESTIFAFSGIRLCDSRTSISLGPDACLRTLSEEEFIELGSNDIFFNEVINFVRYGVSCCLERRRTYRFALLADNPNSMLGVQESPSNSAVSEKSVLRALHIIMVQPIGTYLKSTEWQPKVLCPWRIGDGLPLAGKIGPPSVLERHEIESFIAIEKGLRESPREELRIAADRLIEAMHRSSRVDAIVDAVIGLEILLKPADADELNFRVALNYAFLGPPECRRQRFDEIRDIQKLRNKIVHGSTRHRGPEAEERLGKAAEAAMNALRDALKRFITDPSLQGNKPLDAEFWLKRLFDQKE